MDSFNASALIDDDDQRSERQGIIQKCFSLHFAKDFHNKNCRQTLSEKYDPNKDHPQNNEL